MAKQKTYYSIRVVQASSEKEAIKKIINENFDQSHVLCDRVFAESDVLDEIKAAMDPVALAMRNLPHYVCNAEDADKIIKKLQKAYEKDPHQLVDDIGGITVWEPLEFRFTVKEFCSMIGL